MSTPPLGNRHKKWAGPPGSPPRPQKGACQRPAPLRGRRGHIGTVKEFDDVCEIHIVLQDDVTVDLHESQRDEQDVVGGRDMLGRPDGLPDREDIIIDEFCMRHQHARAWGESQPQS